MVSIVLEGPDNAGKSTLAKKLHEHFGIPIQHSGGPSKYPGEVNERAEIFNSRNTVMIYGRHPCVSQNIYVEALSTGGEVIDYKHVERFYKNWPLLIYCRSKGNLEGHEQSEHSSLEYFSQVEINYSKLCKLYDEWGLKKANFIYRIGDKYDTLISALEGIL